MSNPETQDEKNVRESRETNNIGFIRHRTKTYNTKTHHRKC
jgi:hypothetical protein